VGSLLPPEKMKTGPAAVKRRRVRKLATAGRDESKACGGKVGQSGKLTTAGRNESKACGGKVGEEREACYRRRR